MPFTVRLAHQSKSFIVEDNETILDAALRQDFDIPYSCGEGICGTCEGQIIDGLISYNNPENLVLDEEERACGRALFCSAKANSDLLIDVPGIGVPPNKELAFHEYQLLELNLLSQDVYQALLKPQATAIKYRAGQYIEAQFDEQEAKPFSIANAPNDENIIELHIRCQTDNDYAKALIQWLEQNRQVKLRGPYGNCFYHPTPNMPAIMLAVGTGFAPIKAILQQAFKTGLDHETTLFWAGKSPHDFYQLSLAKEWEKNISNFRLVPILTSATHRADWLGVYGNILDIVLDYYPRLENHHIYFGGPIQLTMDALEHFCEHGAQTYFMYSDAFDLM